MTANIDITKTKMISAEETGVKAVNQGADSVMIRSKFGK